MTLIEIAIFISIILHALSSWALEPKRPFRVFLTELVVVGWVMFGTNKFLPPTPFPGLVGIQVYYLIEGLLFAFALAEFNSEKKQKKGRHYASKYPRFGALLEVLYSPLASGVMVILAFGGSLFMRMNNASTLVWVIYPILTTLTVGCAAYFLLITREKAAELRKKAGGK